ncbi:class I SAM-dependent methyltransferase [Streptomyces sp. NPDC016626]|uniref:class I SAM-dependent methyltransferase n=1 Tax=Streptomyces sp. NPDC016626 TaxID=3364968 RepID=UPI0036F9917E
MTYTARDEWEKHFSDGRGFRQVSERERELLAEHTPAPDGGGRALDVGCGTGELAAYLASLGYTVDACDFADSALAGPARSTPPSRACAGCGWTSSATTRPRCMKRGTTWSSCA